MSWTVYLETDHGTAGYEECLAVQAALHEALRAAVGCPRGSLAATMTVGEETAPRAVQSAVALFSAALLQAGVANDSRVVHAEATEGEALPPVPDVGLITAQGLADRYGVSRQWVNELMRRKGAPDPVRVEGGTARMLVYRTQEAVEFVAGQVRERG